MNTINKKQQSKHGFTLLELVVVMSIIAIMSIVSIPSFISLLASNRDKQRIAHLQQISEALEQYRSNDPANKYPGFITDEDTDDSNDQPVYGWDEINDIQPRFRAYLKTYPQDPSPPSATCTNYLLYSDGKGYTLFTKLENANSKEAKADKPTLKHSPPGTGTTKSFTIGRTGSDPSTCFGEQFNYWITNP